MYKILSIDGGGIKGVFPASFLATIEEDLEGKSIGEYFDLIVGTSTGGLIALALSLGFRASEILKFYEEFGPQIFERRGLLSQLSKAKYAQEPLKKALQELFQDKVIGDCKTRLIIPSVNLNTGEVYMYKTAHHERFRSDYKKPIIEAALATSAAPTYFPVQFDSAGAALVDGGICANNPAGLAAVEAVSVLGWPVGNVQLLSIGCTMEPILVDSDRSAGDMGAAQWGMNLLHLTMAAQSSLSYGTAQLLLGHQNVHRICPMVGNGKFSLDGVDKIPELKGIGSVEGRKAKSLFWDIFLKREAELFQPIYQLV